MAYVNDAQTLADIVSPAAAAAQMGIQNDQANQADNLKNQLDQGQLQARIQQPGLTNMFTQAHTSNENALAQQNQVKAGTDQATQAGGIAATNATNSTKVGAEHIQAAQQVSQIAGQAAAYMDNVPAGQRPAAMQQLAQKYGIDPQQLGPLMSGDPDQLRQFASKTFQSSQAAQQELLKGSVEGQNRMGVQALDNQGKVDVANIQGSARQYAADRQAQTKQILMKTDNVIAQLTAKQASPGGLTPAEATTLNQAREAATTARSNPFINKMLNPDADGTGSPVASAGQAQPGPNGGAGGGRPTYTQETPANTKTIQQLVKQQGGTYDPSKYVYAVGSDGTVVHKPK